MFTLPRLASGFLTASLVLALAATMGCHQLSKTVRSDQVLEESSPVPPDFRASSPELQPVPTELPAPLPQIPLTAPPSDAAKRDALDESGWDFEDIEVVELDAEDFFPEVSTSVSRELLIERTEARAARFAEEGQLAAQRRHELSQRLPVIIPGTPALRPVSAEEFRLLPVPK